MIEEWKDIPEYEGLYQVSNLGNIKSFKFGKEKLLKLNASSNDYLITRLCKNNKPKTFKVHQLMAITFLNHTPCKLDLVVNHINFNKQDNRLDNLEIVTNRVNSNRKHLKSTSKYTGVSWHKNEKKWQVVFRIDNKLKHFGYFENEIDAKNVYQKEINKINSTRCYKLIKNY